MPKIVTQQIINQIVELKDKEKLSFKEIAKKLGLAPDTVAKYYNREKGSTKAIEISEYEKATIKEFLEYAKEHNLKIIDIAERIYELEKAGIDIRNVSEGIEIFKAIKEVGGKKDIKETLLFLKEKKQNVDFFKNFERRIEELKKEKNYLEKKIENLKCSIVLSPEYIVEEIEKVEKVILELVEFFLKTPLGRAAITVNFGVEEFKEKILSIFRKIDKIKEEVKNCEKVSIPQSIPQK